ncbi:60S ribosomal subunit biogenesis RNA-binding protein [Encephalitozoon hellem ATCC 50504]|uniref:BRX1 RNA-binding protein n=1 Tax=Encephalitozoon hellem TaxID=27973 RepID=A0A9Q9C6J6_ENCHE|nr:60S ribosomal subunit biogenesis RNA-binding protein [Encephalitozoon hellem ATCC 50504]AFM97646.1 60S ribosomal subunit biogenesis RNA-binding protein [Encephalitozoon hellem ATCC 50504]UTX42335.1 BRX1 RNA-binding protein [Encephalitozoon hellem]WEL37777.1 BRX1 RNA-binding protein [Encephalitozoon hellem]|eukprot:XP_003886627.1 60S ribosomal subunit biogenesis RNA-binding protein [Encephalitozoon hellem ATCC 50504]
MTSVILSTRGASVKIRHLMRDISKLVKVEEEQKWDMGKDYKELRSLMELNECDSMLFFRSTKRSDDLWIGIHNGMSAVFRIYSLFTVKDCNFPVNSFKDCGYVLMFSKEFEEIEHLGHVKSVIEHVFRSNETKDKALCFFYLDGVIWVRCYKIGKKLEEIGPRLVLEVLKVFEKCFEGNILYKAEENGHSVEKSLD